MERIGVLAAILLFLVAARVSDASYRVLLVDGKGDEKLNTGKVSPSPTPNPSPKNNVSESGQKSLPKKSHQSPSPVPNSTTTSLKIPPPSDNSPNLMPPSGPENNKNGNNSKGSEGSTTLGSPTDKYACHVPLECHKEELVACLQYARNDSKELSLLVQNVGENTLTVEIKVTPPIDINKNIQIAKGNTAKIPIKAMGVLEIVLNAGAATCSLHPRSSPSEWNLFQQLAPYATHVTPIYGAYFLFVFVVIAGGTWACCKFRRGRRANTVIPYQQLEMGAQTQSNSAVVDSNTADGWDESWDEDWDEEEAVPQPSAKHSTGSVSANGLSSRSPRKDGWDVDWDD